MLLNAQSLIDAHIPIWMPKLTILSVSLGITGTSENRPLQKCLENPVILSSNFLILLLYHITHKSTFLLLSK